MYNIPFQYPLTSDMAEPPVPTECTQGKVMEFLQKMSEVLSVFTFWEQ